MGAALRSVVCPSVLVVAMVYSGIGIRANFIWSTVVFASADDEGGDSGGSDGGEDGGDDGGNGGGREGLVEW